MDLYCFVERQMSGIGASDLTVANFLSIIWSRITQQKLICK